jgi:DNA repair protein RecN (Recombination protein N)
MLTELRVRDLGVIEDLALSFGPGMTALTGETGAGKTLLVEALQLVLGGRANPTMVRAGTAEAIVEARFMIGEGDDEQELIVVRSVPAEGRGKSWIDGRMAPASALAEATSHLLEIHGQHEHQSLISATAQRNVLDAFAGTDLSVVQERRARLRELSGSLEDLGGDASSRAREADVLRYQVGEIAGAHISGPEEDELLRVEEVRLADASAYRAAAAEALELLEPAADPGEAGALEALQRSASLLAGRELFDEHRERMVAASIELSDVVSSLRSAVESWDDDPERLVEVGERRRLLAELRRKYGQELSEVLTFGERASKRLESLENAEARAEVLEAERALVMGEIAAAEAVVRDVRLRAAESFAQLVGERLGDLAMSGARIEVRVGSEGAGEPIEIALGANVGEAVLPIAKAASGGELARSMLAIRLVGMGGPQTMVFDEVDAGVGGTAALALGTALHEVSTQRQVLVVTHLAQVAAKADHQVTVHKQEVGGRTVTTAAVVEGEERVKELSRMLSGHPDSDAARAHARELLGPTEVTLF